MNKEYLKRLAQRVYDHMDEIGRMEASVEDVENDIMNNSEYVIEFLLDLLENN